MSDHQLSELAQSQRDRLAYLELRLWFFGEIRRQDLVNRFDIQSAAATRDLAAYKALAPRNLEYDAKAKVYVCGLFFTPLFNFPIDRVLTWLTQGFGDAEPNVARSIVSSELMAPAILLKLEHLSAVTRAIYKKVSVEISYRSLTSGLSTREIIPFSLAQAANRWHVRAFDRRSNSFRDFALNRIADAKLLGDEAQENELSEQDIQWNRKADIELVPHPANVKHPDTIEAEYGMIAGVLRKTVRASMIGYLLRAWNVDCTPDHSLRGAEYHLWLKNRQALYGIENLMLAPGYEIKEDK